MTSWKPEVRVANDDTWYGNGTRFATKEEAEAYTRDLEMRWTAVREARAVETDEPVNYALVDGRAVWIEEFVPHPLTKANGSDAH